MESLNEKLDKILYFLSIFQNACENKRSLIEQYSRKCYSTYLTELKANQKKEDLKKNLPPIQNEKKEENKVALLSEGVEELAIADSLLEKARAIRSKNKKFLNQEGLTFPTSTEKVEKSSITTASITTAQEKLLRCQSRHTLLTFSKSNSSIESCKISKLQHSNSLDSQVCMKRNKVPTSRPCSKNNSEGFLAVFKDNIVDNPNVGVVSHKQLKDFKSSPVSQTSTENSSQKSTNKPAQSPCHVSKSDSSRNVFKKSALSYHSFRDSLKDKFQSNFQWKKDGFWYPFINSKSERYLLEWTKCDSYGSFMKIIKLLYRIQELMLWLDLLYLIGKEVFPIVLYLDENDKNVVRFCNSLLSIYHERLQRKPLLNIK